MNTASSENIAALDDNLHSSDVSAEQSQSYFYPADFTQALQSVLSGERPHGGLMIVSIDNMAMVINGYGHAESERVIAKVRDALMGVVPDGAGIFRLQRDQLAVIVPEMSDEGLERAAREWRQLIRRLVLQMGDHSMHLLCSIGLAPIAQCRIDHGVPSVQDVIDHAYVALNFEQLDSRPQDGQVISSREESIRHMEMTSYLHQAIHEKKLCLAYQPIVKSSDGSIAHYECLLRLTGDDGSITSAGALIPVAERMGMIDIIDQLVLEMVVEDLLRSPDVVLAFNISNITTSNPEWLDTFVKIVESTPEIASRIIVEITETAAEHDIRDTAYFVASIQALGCRVALDDFGSGHTSFRQLKALSCDMVKIDGSFIKDLDTNKDNRFFVKTMLDCVQAMGMVSVAEWVENGEIAKILMDMGCGLQQGFYFGAGETTRKWLKR